MESSRHPVIVITGASSGIGEATARLFAQKQYRVVLAARRIELLNKISAEIDEFGGVAFPIQTDMTNLTDIQSLVSQTLARFGRIDVLFNNAGFGHMNWLENTDVDADIRSQLEVNLVGMILLTREVLPHMLMSKSGHIINMSSLSGYIGTPTYTIYAASKFGVRGFTEALRREVSPIGIFVTGIYPGGVDSEFRQHMGYSRKTGITTPSWLRLEQGEIASAVYQVTVKYQRIVILPKIMKLAIQLNRFIPGWVDWIIARRFTNQERSQSSKFT